MNTNDDIEFDGCQYIITKVNLDNCCNCKGLSCYSSFKEDINIRTYYCHYLCFEIDILNKCPCCNCLVKIMCDEKDRRECPEMQVFIDIVNINLSGLIKNDNNL